MNLMYATGMTKVRVRVWWWWWWWQNFILAG